MPVPDQPHNSTKPPLALTTPGHEGEIFDFGEDPARYIVRPEQGFERPWLSVPGGKAFIWPLGTEGFEYTGQATLGVHKYIGEMDIEVNIIHRDEPHIIMSGVFPGNTGVANMKALIEVLRAETPEKGKILHLPFILPNTQFVYPQTWRFNHAEDDRTRTIAYNVEFLRAGAGKKASTGPANQDPSENPIVKAEPKGEQSREFIVRDGFRTLKTISKKVYGTPDKWTKLFDLNEKKLNKLGISRQEAATHKLPLGVAIAY